MIYKTRFPLLLLLLNIWCASLSGQHRLSGRIVADDLPLPFAEVLLQDSTGKFVVGNFSEADGNFELLASAGTYLLKASYLGYAPLEKNVVLTGDLALGDLNLSGTGEDLTTVTVTAGRQLVEQRADRLVFNVSQSVAAAGGSALDALRLAPGVRLQNGALELIGRGNPGVLLNGRLLQLSSEELTDFLAGLIADDIETIEVISNPPARYAAAGQGGLLNIVLKKGRGNTWKNSTSVSRTQAFYGHTNVSNSFIYKRDKVSVSANAGIRQGFQRDFERIAATFPTAKWKTSLINKSSRDNLTGRLALDYDVSDKFSIGGQYLGNFGQPRFDGMATTIVRAQTGTLDSTLVNQLTADRAINSHTANLHASWQLDTLGRRIDFGFDLFDYDNVLELGSEVKTFLADGSFAGLNLAQVNFSDQLIDNLNAQVDIAHPLPDAGVELSYGGSLSRTTTFGDQRNFDTRQGSPVFDPTLSNEFTYQENIQAVYLSASGKWGDTWDWKLGLRAENTQTEGYSKTLDQRTPNNYLKLFPTLYLNYRPDDDHQYTFSYGRRINRPGFRNLNPFRIYANSNSYSEGNPFLQPSFTDRVEFTHAWRGLRTNLFFNRTLDGHGTLFSAEQDGQVQAVLRRNYFRDHFFGIGESYTLEVGKWTSSNQAFGYVGVTKVLPGFEVENQNGVQINLSSDNTITIGDGTLEINAWYNAPHRSNVFTIAATYSVSIGWRQSIGQSLTLSLLANDIFDTASLRSLATVVNGVRTVYAQNYASRHLRFTASYRFGNDTIDVRERGFGNDRIRGRSR